MSGDAACLLMNDIGCAVPLYTGMQLSLACSSLPHGETWVQPHPAEVFVAVACLTIATLCCGLTSSVHHTAAVLIPL